MPDSTDYKREMLAPLPAAEQLDGLLDLRAGDDVRDLVASSLLQPLDEFLRRPGKRIRGNLVELGFALSGQFGAAALSDEEARLCAEASQLVEVLHAGSLVVDDIEDGSHFRRGELALHLCHGVPVALNAANWLYFWPLERIAGWGLEPARELKLHRLFHRTLLRAHFGQSLDVGVGIDRLDRSRIPSVVRAAMELKTGALMALGLSLGAVLGAASEERVDLLGQFGHRFGVAFQMFDDLGNLKGAKQYEDLRLRRPSWVWSCAASFTDEKRFRRFVAAVEALPEDRPLRHWLAEEDLVARAKREAERELDSAVEALRRALESRGDYETTLDEIERLTARIRGAYG